MLPPRSGPISRPATLPAAILRRLQADPLRIAAIVIGNAIPVFGAIFLGWSAFSIVLFYWLENVAVGVFTLVRMVLAGLRKGALGVIGAGFMGTFFSFHYGMFTAVHGLFVIALLAPQGPLQGGPDAVLGEPVTMIVTIISEYARQPAVALGIGLLVVSQLVWLVRDARRTRMFLDADLSTLMGAPYGRIIVLHVAIIAGAGAVMALGQPWAMVVLLAVLKMLGELGAALKVRDKVQAPPASAQTS